MKHISSKAKHILGLVYRHFYKHSDMKTLHQLYVSLVQLHCGIHRKTWTQLRKPSTLLPEFALKTGILVITTWTFLSYLHLHNVVCTQIVHGLLCFPHNVVVPMWCTSSLMGGCGLGHECKTLGAENPTELGIW